MTTGVQCPITHVATAVVWRTTFSCGVNGRLNVMNRGSSLNMPKPRSADWRDILFRGERKRKPSDDDESLEDKRVGVRSSQRLEK